MNGTAPSDYRDPAAFFAKSYPARGMRRLLKAVCLRLSGGGGGLFSIHDSSGKEIKNLMAVTGKRADGYLSFHAQPHLVSTKHREFQGDGTGTLSKYRLVAISLTSSRLSKYVEKDRSVFPVFADPCLARRIYRSS